MFDFNVLFPFVSDVLPNLLQPYFFLYLGPDTLLPAASICGGLIGFVLIFWRYIAGIVKKLYMRVTNQEELFEEDTGPDTDTNTEILDA